jgi:hypothetical protein
VVVASFLIPFTNILICSLRDPVFGGKVSRQGTTYESWAGLKRFPRPRP